MNHSCVAQDFGKKSDRSLAFWWMWMGKHFSERPGPCKIPKCKQGNFRVAQIEYIIRKGKESKIVLNVWGYFSCFGTLPLNKSSKGRFSDLVTLQSCSSFMTRITDRLDTLDMHLSLGLLNSFIWSKIKDEDNRFISHVFC